MKDGRGECHSEKGCNLVPDLKQSIRRYWRYLCDFVDQDVVRERGTFDEPGER